MDNKFYKFYGDMNMRERVGTEFIEENRIPSCINDGFCNPTPNNRNDGILAMAFVDMQPLESVYPQETAFCNGTLFPNLNKPFYGGYRR